MGGDDGDGGDGGGDAGGGGKAGDGGGEGGGGESGGGDGGDGGGGGGGTNAVAATEQLAWAGLRPPRSHMAGSSAASVVPSPSSVPAGSLSPPMATWVTTVVTAALGASKRPWAFNALAMVAADRWAGSAETSIWMDSATE